MFEFSTTGCDHILDFENDKNITSIYLCFLFTYLQMQRKIQCSTKYLLNCGTNHLFISLSDYLNHIAFHCLWLQKNFVHHLLPWKMDFFKLVIKDILYIYNIPNSTCLLDHNVFLLPWWNSMKILIIFKYYVYFSSHGKGFRLWLFFFGPRGFKFCRRQCAFYGMGNQCGHPPN